MRVKDSRFQQGWADYAERYGASPRTIQRWVAVGDKAGNQVPLDDPETMPKWWAAVMSHQVPGKLLAAVVEARKMAARPPSEPSVDIPDPRPTEESKAQRESAPIEMRPVGEHEVGLLATLNRLQESEVFAHRTYQEALQKGEEARAKMALKSFTDLASEVVKVQDRYAKHLEATRELIPRVEAESVLADLHGDILTRLRGLSDSVCREFGIAVSPDSERRWQKLVDAFCAMLQEEVFTPG